MLITPCTWHDLATERWWRAVLALCLLCAKANALKWDIELWELLSIVFDL